MCEKSAESLLLAVLLIGENERVDDMAIMRSLGRASYSIWLKMVRTASGSRKLWSTYIEYSPVIFQLPQLDLQFFTIGSSILFFLRIEALDLR